MVKLTVLALLMFLIYKKLKAKLVIDCIGDHHTNIDVHYCYEL